MTGARRKGCWKLLGAVICFAVLGCDEGASEPDAAVDAGVSDISELEFAPFELWAEPIADYIAYHEADLGGASFHRAIFDLTVFDDRLFLGYGDADKNLGRETPIELRYWPEPEPDAVTADFATDEEQVDRYRHGDGVLLVPGVDATEDDLLGNAYIYEAGGEWYKSRTLELAWHVHDIAELNGSYYACGSGGTIDDYNDLTVKALFYRSDDGGELFELLAEVPHPDPPGDHRFTNLLAVAGDLLAFGYVSQIEGTSNTITELIAYALDGDELTAVSGWDDFWVTNTAALSADLGLVVGVNVASSTTWGCRLVREVGSYDEAPACNGKTVLDVEPLGDGRALVAHIEGDEYPTVAEAGVWGLRVGLTADGEQLQELVTGAFDSYPRAVALWRDSLYLGLDDGTVWRAEGF